MAQHADQDDCSITSHFALADLKYDAPLLNGYTGRAFAILERASVCRGSTERSTFPTLCGALSDMRTRAVWRGTVGGQIAGNRFHARADLP